MNRKLRLVFAICAALPVSALAQQAPATPAMPAAPATPANPITASEKGVYGYIMAEVVGGAEKMPEENYSFKPTPDVRSFGQLVGHIADAQYEICSMAIGDSGAGGKGIEKTKTSKADLIAALKDGIAYCNKAFAGMTDAKGSEMVKMMNYNVARLAVLSVNTAHADEHYGNMVTYLRLKGIVPPSSERRPGPPQQPSSDQH